MSDIAISNTTCIIGLDELNLVDFRISRSLYQEALSLAEENS